MTRIILVISTGITIIASLIANILPSNGKTSHGLFEQYPIFFIPERYVFSIWLLIYLGMLAFNYFQFNPASRVSNNTRKWFIASNLFILAWLLSWHYQYSELSAIFMIGTLISLLAVYRKSIKSTELWYYKFPISLYLGWVSFSTITLISILLFKYKLSTPFISPEIWTSVILLLITILGCIQLIKYRDYVFNLVIIWCIIGIIVKWNNYSLIVFPALFCIGIIMIIGILMQIKKLEFNIGIRPLKQKIENS